MTDNEIKIYFDTLEEDLRKNRDCSKELHRLSLMSVCDDVSIRQRASWCVAKMGQNKIADGRIVNILSLMKKDRDPQVRENVAWGIGEIAGANISNNDSVSVVLYLMSDHDNDVRAMAAWAAGRLRHKLGIDEGITEKLRELENDGSSYVRKCVEFALNDETLLSN
ncbi:MAG: HEAT repeat domain-containing protein [archaeon]|nr:HEAT repeat domain-containing protein [archaeon]